MKNYAHVAIGITAVCIITSIAPDVQANATAFPTLTPTSLPAFQLARRYPFSWRVGVRPSRYRVGGFSRSPKSCDGQTQVTAFVPPPRAEEKIPKNDGAIDTTASSHPTFWVHLAGVPQDTLMQFTLQEEAFGNEKSSLYETKFQSNGKTGILGVRLPQTKPRLEVGKRYVWQMAIICNPNDRSADRVLGSWVQRIDPAQIKPTQGFDPKPLVKGLARASEQEKPALYAGLGIWQDAVTTLINLQLKQPKNQEFKDDWRSLLTEAQMKAFINAPLLGVK